MNTLRIVKNEPEMAREYMTGMAGKYQGIGRKYQEYIGKYQQYIWCAALLATWFLMPLLMGDTALVTDGLWQLVLMSGMCFLGMVGLCWWLLKRFWTIMGLPGLGSMVLRYKQMKLCHQLGFYLACFALLLLVALGCLIAVL